MIIDMLVRSQEFLATIRKSATSTAESGKETGFTIYQLPSGEYACGELLIGNYDSMEGAQRTDEELNRFINGTDVGGIHFHPDTRYPLPSNGDLWVLSRLTQLKEDAIGATGIATVTKKKVHVLWIECRHPISEELAAEIFTETEDLDALADPRRGAVKAFQKFGLSAKYVSLNIKQLGN